MMMKKKMIDNVETLRYFALCILCDDDDDDDDAFTIMHRRQQKLRYKQYNSKNEMIADSD